jgi:exonuclease III
MKILSWNYQGSGNPRTVRALKKPIASQAPEIVFLMETKQLSTNLSFLSYFNDSYNIKVVDCTTSGGGRAGGLALLWNNCNFDINIQMHDFNYINFLINSHNMVWRATSIYGYPNNSNKFLTCKLINHLSETNNNPNWLVFGDFNIILKSDEKMGRCPMDYNITSSFRNSLDMCNLADLGFSGPRDTWHNRQQGNDYIQARLDRFFATTN